MGEFMTMEEAATQLEVPEATLRQWIQRGRARASRRGGTYVLRLREVERIAQTELGVTLSLQPAEAPERLLTPINLKLGLTSAETAEGESEKPRKALPPRPRDAEEGEPGIDRRKRLGRRKSDFSLEILANEVRQAVAQGLDPANFSDVLKPLLDGQRQLLQRLERLQPQPSSPLLQVLPRNDEALQEELDELRHTVAARERQLRHSQQENVALRQRSLELEGLRDVATRNQELTAQLAAAQAHGAELALETGELRSEIRGLKARLNDANARPQADPASEERARAAEAALRQAEGELRQARAHEAELRGELELMQRAHLETLASSEGANGQLLELERELMRERSQVSRLAQELEDLRREAADAVGRQAETERLRAELQQLQEKNMRYEGERARLATEFTSLRNEAENAWETSRRAEDQARQLHEQFTTASQQLERVQNRLNVYEREHEQNQRRFDEREQQLSAENRRLKEQLTELQYRSQMADSSHSMANLEDSRRMMDQLVELQNLMEEKDRQITQDYSERSELRAKLEELNRAHYELQHRYEKEKEEWSQVVARQIQAASNERDRAAAQPPPGPPPSSKKDTSWGKGLFKLKGDV